MGGVSAQNLLFYLDAEGLNITDKSADPVSITVNGSDVMLNSTDFKVGLGSIRFNGSTTKFDGIEISGYPENNKLNLTAATEFTITVWVNPTRSSAFQKIYGWGVLDGNCPNADDCGIAASFWNNENHVNIRIYNETLNFGGFSDGGPRVNTNNWTFVIYKSDAINSTHINLSVTRMGNFYAIENLSASMRVEVPKINNFHGGLPPLIGMEREDTDRIYQGLMDEFCIWDTALNDSDITHLYNDYNGSRCSDIINPNVGDFGIFSCTAPTVNGTINFTIFNEDSPASFLTSNVSANFEIFLNGSRGNIVNYSFELSGQNSYLFCLNNTESNVNADAVIKYTATNGFTNTWILQNQSLTNRSGDIDAGNVDNTGPYSDLVGTVRDRSGFQEISGIVVSLQREYVGEGLWRTVQMDKTGDFGTIFFNIVEGSQSYRLIFQDLSNTILRQTDSVKFVCSGGICTVNFLVDIDVQVGAIGLQISDSFDNDTGILTVQWLDPIQVTDSVSFRVSKETFSRSNTVCSETQTGFSGTFTCNTTAFQPPFLLQVSRSASPDVFQFTKQIGTLVSDLRAQVNDPQLLSFYAAILVIAIGSAGAAVGAIGASAMLIFAIVVAWMLKFFTFLEIGVLLALGIGTIVIAVKIRSKGT